MQDRTLCSRFAGWISYGSSEAATVQISTKESEWINSELKVSRRYMALVSRQPCLNFFYVEDGVGWVILEIELLSAAGLGRQPHAHPIKSQGMVRSHQRAFGLGPRLIQKFLEGLLKAFHVLAEESCLD